LANSSSRPLDGPQQLVELELHGRGAAVLGVLDQEDHQAGDDGRAGVDHQLPAIREAEERADDGPGDDGPRGDKPVYCSECFSKQRSFSGSYR
jgi:hypothetical protein